jgi:diacylglycerol O-acyltransferase / wax synthase
VKAIREKCGTSVNDVILTVVTGTIRRYCEWHGDPVKGKLFRMMVPVNLRGNEDPAGLGNRISLVPVTVPLNIRDPKKLLAAVHKRTEFLKRVHAAELVSLAGGLIGMFPTSVQGLAGPLASQLPITPFNLVCTNIPGPQFPLYLLGHKMLVWYPYVPIGGEMAVNCAILSYNGKVYFGFSGDVHAAPDLKRMEKLLETSFVDLREAVGLRPPQKKSVSRKRHAVSVAAAREKTVLSKAPVTSPSSVVEEKRKPDSAPPSAAEQPLAHLVVA